MRGYSFHGMKEVKLFLMRIYNTVVNH